MRKVGYSRTTELNNLLTREHFYPISYTEPDDIFIVGFPKSGNTWMQHLLTGIFYGIDTQFLPDKVVQEIVPDVHSKRYYKRFDRFAYFKSHHLPLPEYRRVVYLVRDGRDAILSYHAMLTNQGKVVSLEEMVLHGHGIFPCKWHEHVRQWLENPYDADVLVIRYEDLLQNTRGEMERFCQFAKIERSTAVLDRAIAGCTFSEMQRKERHFGWNNRNWPTDKPFVRQGTASSYKDSMPPHLIDEFDKMSSRELARMKYYIDKT